MAKLFSLFAFLIWLVLGLYLINYSIGFISIPSFIKSIDKIIILIGGLFVIFGGINYLRLPGKTQMQQQMINQMPR